MKYFLILLLISFSINSCNSNNFEEIRLQNYDINSLNVPKTNYEKSYSINPEDEDESYFLETEDDVFENKAGKIFSKFVDDKVINNKINKFGSKI